MIDSARTDATGNYQFLLFPYNDYKLYLAKDGYLPDSLEINTRHIMKGDIRNDFVLEKIFIHKLAVFYAFNKSDIAPGQDEPLEEVTRILKKYPKSYLLIGAHADSRGTFDYNMALSERRAQSAKDYIMAKNIKAGRIFTRAFGESLIINRCVDGVHCSEIEHAKNRRADLKVVLTLPEDTTDLEF